MKRDIVILSSQYWDDAWFRKHQFAVRFARDGHRVFYVEPSHSLARQSHVAGVGRNPLWGVAARSVPEGLTVVTTGRLLPKPNEPYVSRINAALTWRRVCRYLRERGVREPLVIVYDVRLVSALEREIDEGRVVVDLVDDLSDYPGSRPGRAHVAASIRRLCEGAARVIYTSPRLADIYPATGPWAVVPNGFDAALFNESVSPTALAGGPPYVGFIGTLFSFLDYSYFAAVADQVPECTLVLVGRVERTDAEVAELTRRSNVVHLGYVEKESVPGIVAAFDVCIAPFRAGQVADSVSPLKLYEYLAMRKRVVATPLAGVMADKIGPFVAFADTPDAFAARVREGLEAGPIRDPRLEEAIAEYSWDALYTRVAAVLGEELLER